MKKQAQKSPLSGSDLGKLYPTALTYDERAKLDQQTANRINSSRPKFPACRTSLALSGVLAFWIASIRLGWLSFGLNAITGVSFSMLLALASVGVLVWAYGYVKRLFDYQNRDAGGFFAIYAILFFAAWGVAGFFVQADFIKLAFSPLWMMLALLANTIVTYMLAGLFIDYKRN